MMESNLTKLLRECDERRIDRRQLFQALGLSAAGAFALAVAPRLVFGQEKPPAGPPGGMAAKPAGALKAFPVTTMNHLSYQCGPDYVKTRDWHMHLASGWISWDNGKQAEVSFGDPNKPEGLYIRPAGAGGKPSIGHFAFGIPNVEPLIEPMKVEMERWKLTNIRPDGAHGWISDDPAGYMLNTWVPEKSYAMYPGAAGPCKDAHAPSCKEGYEAGHKNLAAMPKANGKGFKVRYFSNANLIVPKSKLQVEKDFYTGLLGMKIVAESGSKVALRYGGNAMILEGTLGEGEKPYCTRFGYQVDGYDHAKAEAILKGLGLTPKAVGKVGWTVADPDGLVIDIAGPGFAEAYVKM